MPRTVHISHRPAIHHAPCTCCTHRRPPQKGVGFLSWMYPTDCAGNPTGCFALPETLLGTGSGVTHSSVVRKESTTGTPDCTGPKCLVLHGFKSGRVLTVAVGGTLGESPGVANTTSYLTGHDEKWRHFSFGAADTEAAPPFPPYGRKLI